MATSCHLNDHMSYEPSLGPFAPEETGNKKPSWEKDTKSQCHQQAMDVRNTDPAQVTASCSGILWVTRQHPQII